MSNRERLAEKFGAAHWDDELLALWSYERISRLEEAIRAITYADDGRVRNSFQPYVDLGEKAPILYEVWADFRK